MNGGLWPVMSHWNLSNNNFGEIIQESSLWYEPVDNVTDLAFVFHADMLKNLHTDGAEMMNACIFLHDTCTILMVTL